MVLGNNIEHFLLASSTSQVIVSSDAHGTATRGLLSWLAEPALFTSAQLG
jgi:hypothetical protein